MKKNITLLLIAAALMSAPLTAAAEEIGVIGGADGPTTVEVYDEAYEDPFIDTYPDWHEEYEEKETVIDGITYKLTDIYYNSQYLTPGIIINDRAMMPFRDFFEAIGADVDYNESDKTVTASRWDTKISFKIGSNIIHVVRDGEESDIEMDVAPVILENEVYAPVRFLSEAFAAQVGWNGYWKKTVLIADYEKYSNELMESSPNIKKLSELEQKQAENSTSGMDMTFKFDMVEPIYDYSDWSVKGTENTNISMGISTESKTAGEVSETMGTVNLSVPVDDETQINLTDANVNIITDGTDFYIKTDILKQLEGINEELALASALTSPEQWYKISLEDFVNTIFNAADIYMDYSDLEEIIENASEPRRLLERVFEQKTLYSTYSVDTVSEQFKIVEAIDKYIVINEEDSGNYTVSFDFTLENLYEVIRDITGEYEEWDEFVEEFEAETSPEFYISELITVENGIAVSSIVKVNISMENTEDNVSVSLSFDMDSYTNLRSEPENIEIPADYADLTELLDLLEYAAE